MQELKDKITDLKARCFQHWCVFDVSKKEKQIVELESISAQPDLWQDPSKAQSIMRQLSDNRK